LVTKVAALLEKVVNKIGRAFNGIGVGVLMLMMFFVAVDVFLRYVLNSPILGAYEAVELMMAVVFSFGIAYTQIHKGHVAVSVVVSKLGERTQSIIDSVVYLISFAIFALLTWRAFLKARVSWLSGETTYGGIGPFGHVPVSPFVYLVGFACTVFCLVLLMDFLNSLTKVLRK